MLKGIPKGRLIIIGGGEDKGHGDIEIAKKNYQFKPMEILHELLPPQNTNASIEIVTTATRQPHAVASMYRNAMKKVGFKKVRFMYMTNTPETLRPSYIKRMKKADVVFFSGGDQYRLSVIMGNSPLMDIIRDRYYEDKDFIVAGTSAGAMAMTTLMMFEGENNEAILKGTVKISSGLGLMEGCIVDTHFTRRGRFGRLAQAVIMNPTCVGIGIGEDTALVIKKGKEARCIGSGMVIIIDGKHIGYTNMPHIQNNDPVCIQGLEVHILCRDAKYFFDKRTFAPPRKDRLEEIKDRMK
jgi:cyanophycinase